MLKDSSADQPTVPAAPVTPAAGNAVPPGGPGARPGRKSMGTKEIIPFEWKLVGESGGAILTLFKAVDREEVEAQLERVRRDGYYRDLRVLDANARIVQPKPAPRKASPSEKQRAARSKPTKVRKSMKKTKAAAKTALKPAAPKRKSNASSPASPKSAKPKTASRKKAAVKSAVKSPKKSAKRKTKTRKN